jgi:hypothetical protein
VVPANLLLLEDKMANVNQTPETIQLLEEEECVPSNVVRNSAGYPVLTADGSYRTSGEEQLDPGPQSARSQGLYIGKDIPKSLLVSESNPAPPGGVGRLNQLRTKAVMTVIGKAVSGFSYTFVSGAQQAGKYQLDADILTSLGYVKSDYYALYGRSTITKDGAWSGLDGVDNLQTWSSSTGIQEKAMYRLLTKHYETMNNNGAIKSMDNLCTIAGMLCVAHILGTGVGTEKNPGAKRWRETGGGQNINGFTGTYFFALGRYAIDVLASKS